MENYSKTISCMLWEPEQAIWTKGGHEKSQTSFHRMYRMQALILLTLFQRQALVKRLTQFWGNTYTD